MRAYLCMHYFWVGARCSAAHFNPQSKLYIAAIFCIAGIQPACKCVVNNFDSQWTWAHIVRVMPQACASAWRAAVTQKRSECCFFLVQSAMKNNPQL